MLLHCQIVLYTSTDIAAIMQHGLELFQMFASGSWTQLNFY